MTKKPKLGNIELLYLTYYNLRKFNDFFCFDIGGLAQLGGRYPHGQVLQRFAAHFARQFERCSIFLSNFNVPVYVFGNLTIFFLFSHRGLGASGRHPHGQVRQRFAAHFARHFERCFVIAKA